MRFTLILRINANLWGDLRTIGIKVTRENFSRWLRHNCYVNFFPEIQCGQVFIIIAFTVTFHWISFRYNNVSLTDFQYVTLHKSIRQVHFHHYPVLRRRLSAKNHSMTRSSLSHEKQFLVNLRKKDPWKFRKSTWKSTRTKRLIFVCTISAE